MKPIFFMSTCPESTPNTLSKSIQFFTAHIIFCQVIFITIYRYIRNFYGKTWIKFIIRCKVIINNLTIFIISTIKTHIFFIFILECLQFSNKPAVILSNLVGDLVFWIVVILVYYLIATLLPIKKII